MKTITKNLILTFCLFTLSFLGCKAQTVIPIETFYASPRNITKGDYIKDVNGILNKYIVVWSGVYENKNFVFEVKKSTLTNNGFTRDLLYMRYRITDSTGNEIINTLSLPDNSYYTIEGLRLDVDGDYWLYYQGYDSNCGQSGQVLIHTIPEKNNQSMMLRLLPDRGDVLSDCPNETEITQLLPTKTFIILTKQ